MSTLFVDEVSIVVDEDDDSGGGVTAAALAAEIAARIAADALLIPLTQKGAAGGVATLDGNSLVPVNQLPPIVLSGQTFVVSSDVEMLALDANIGDTAIREDLDPDGFFILFALPATVIGNWRQILSPGSVQSVDGRTGTVSLADRYDPLGAYLLAPAEFSKAGTVAVARGKAGEPITSNRTISSVTAILDTAPSGADMILALVNNGSTAATFRILDGTKAVTLSGLSIGLTVGDVLTLDVLQVGDLVAGWDLTVKVLFVLSGSGSGFGGGGFGEGGFGGGG